MVNFGKRPTCEKVWGPPNEVSNFKDDKRYDTGEEKHEDDSEFLVTIVAIHASAVSQCARVDGIATHLSIAHHVHALEKRVVA